MGSVFARPPARAGLADLTGSTVALVPHGAPPLAGSSVERPVVLCLGAERDGLPGDLIDGATARATIPLRPGGPESLNVAMAATVALYELNRMAGHA
jgi:tRNA G18 (ribose-2'-O)-methylase SpoU